MKNVGIITKHCVPNYGAMLQAYGLCSCLNRLGYNAELVDYYQPATTNYYRAKLSFPPPVRHWLRLFRCAQFVKKRQVCSSNSCTSVEGLLPNVKRYDCLITGSDQVWFTGPVQYYDPMYFLDFPFEHGKKISYAPSVGGIDSFGEYRDSVRNALLDFDHISVRDENTFRLVQESTGLTPEVVLDPTFLHDFKELIGTASPSKERYLVLFGRIPECYEHAILETARRMNVKEIVSLQYNNRIATRRIASPSPETWLTYLHHSEFVATTYFHGTVFAIKFRKPFVSIPTSGRVKKVKALLGMCGLEERLVVSDSGALIHPDATGEVIDWPTVEARIEPRVKDSLRFLKNALSGEE